MKKQFLALALCIFAASLFTSTAQGMEQLPTPTFKDKIRVMAILKVLSDEDHQDLMSALKEGSFKNIKKELENLPDFDPNNSEILCLYRSIFTYVASCHSISAQGTELISYFKEIGLNFNYLDPLNEFTPLCPALVTAWDPNNDHTKDERFNAYRFAHALMMNGASPNIKVPSKDAREKAQPILVTLLKKSTESGRRLTDEQRRVMKLVSLHSTKQKLEESCRQKEEKLLKIENDIKIMELQLNTQNQSKDD